MQNGYQQKMTFVRVDRTMGMEGPVEGLWARLLLKTLSDQKTPLSTEFFSQGASSMDTSFGSVRYQCYLIQIIERIFGQRE